MLLSKPYKIKHLRLSSGLSLRELAALSKVHYSTISAIESAEKHVNPKTAKLISNALHTKLTDLFTVQEEKEGAKCELL